MNLRQVDIDELVWVSQQRSLNRGTQPPYTGYTRSLPRAHRLVRMGYLKRERFSEHIRGEPRFHWWAFYLTQKGREAIGLTG